MSEFIPLEELIPHRIYRLKSRNLVVGVWKPESQGFLGVREKFNERYLFLEYHYDLSETHGTAQALELLPEILPERINLAAYLSPRCDLHNVEMEFAGQVAKGGKGWVHVDTETPCSGTPVSEVNHELFDVLDPWDKKISEGMFRKR